MVGKIIGINDNQVIINVQEQLDKLPNIINLYVIIEDERGHVVGEITDVKDNLAYINLLGEITDHGFIFGVINKPSFHSTIKLIPDSLVSSIIGVENFKENKDLYIGDSAIYKDIKVTVPINDFFSKHFAIFGATGSGKSCGTARVIQNLFEKQDVSALGSNIFIFDAYGEYHSAFNNINKYNPNMRFKTFTTNLNFPDTEILKIPVWLLGIDDLALLLGVDKPTQLPVIEAALKLVNVFCQDEEKVIKHKNNIISRALLDILSSGRNPSQIRDQIMSVLSYYNTESLNLETPIFVPGYTRPFRQCLLIDSSGKIRDMELIIDFVKKFIVEDLVLDLPDGSFKYSLMDLKQALDFALISEGSLKSEKIYDETNVLRVRLGSLINSEYSKYFIFPEYITKRQYIAWLLTGNGGKKAQIINFNINYVDDRFAKSITKIFSKMLFDYAKELKHRGTFPIHIVLEEAHRYVQNDSDIGILGYNIFERITKEGRKYGVMLGLISQRPSELSETVLSQCSNFMIFKMLHPKDIGYIKEFIPNVSDEIIRSLKVLQPGTCVAFGSAFKVPVIIRMKMPDPAPSSENCNVSGLWFNQ